MADKTGYRPEECGAIRKWQDQGDGTAAEVVARPSSSDATTTNVNASASGAVLKAANTSRRGLIVDNDADKALFLKYGTDPSTSSFTVKVAAGGYWEMPNPIYLGAISGIWESDPTGAARVTELA